MSEARAIAEWRADAQARAMTFGLALLRWRTGAGLTPGQAAGRIGISSFRYQTFEQRDFDPFELAPGISTQIMQRTGLEGADLGIFECDRGACPVAGGEVAPGGVASPVPAFETALAERPVPPFVGWRERGWRIGLRHSPDGWRVEIELSRDRLTPAETAELAAELFKEAALALA